MMAQPGLGSQCLPRGAPGGLTGWGKGQHEAREPHLGRCSSGMAELGETIWSYLRPGRSPGCSGTEREHLSSRLAACVSRSAHPAHSTAGPGASPGGCGRLPSLPSGSAVDLGAGPNSPAVSELLQQQGKAPIPIPCRQVWWRREAESGRDTSEWGHRELWELLQ